MKRTLVLLAAITGCAASVAAGYWLGFRDAWHLGMAADYLPRAAVAAHQLQHLRAGRMRPVLTGLEFEVDNGLSWGYEVFGHPLRDLWGPLWGLRVYPEYERYAELLARYRKQYPSLLEAEAFDKELAQGARETKAKIDRMVERYGAGR